MSFSNPFTVSNIKSDNGFKIDGLTPGGETGSRLATTDLNGDGISDLVITSGNYNYYSGSFSGAVHVIFGSTDPFPLNYNLTSLNGKNGFAIYGNSLDQLGYSILGADINGDNISDLLISAIGGNIYAKGTVYGIYGSKDPFPAIFDLSSLNATTGVVIKGSVAQGGFGVTLADLGDINGDNITDFGVGAPDVNKSTGATYIFYGNRSFPPSLDVGSLDSTYGFNITGAYETSYFGRSIAGIDINNDNKRDLVVGAYGEDNYTGKCYTFLNQGSGFSIPQNITTLDGTNGFKFMGESPNSNTCFSLANVANFTGDGKDSLLIGAFTTNSNAGAAYLVLPNNNFSTVYNLSALNGSDGTKFTTSVTNDKVGQVVTNGENLCANEMGSLLIDAPGRNSGYGSTFVVCGTNQTLSAVIDLNNLGSPSGINGLIFNNNNNTSTDFNLGTSSTAGDFNGDGTQDVAIGAPGADNSSNGVVYTLFGPIAQNPQTSPTISATPSPSLSASPYNSATPSPSVNASPYNSATPSPSTSPSSDYAAAAGILPNELFLTTYHTFIENLLPDLF